MKLVGLVDFLFFYFNFFLIFFCLLVCASTLPQFSFLKMVVVWLGVNQQSSYSHGVIPAHSLLSSQQLRLLASLLRERRDSPTSLLLVFFFCFSLSIFVSLWGFLYFYFVLYEP